MREQQTWSSSAGALAGIAPFSISPFLLAPGDKKIQASRETEAQKSLEERDKRMLK